MIKIAIINSNTNICENVSEDSRPINQINVPGYILLNLETTETIKWNWNPTLDDWEEIEGSIGTGGIGYTYINGKLKEPKPTVKLKPPGENSNIIL
jgi:hypothetical protein